VLIPAMFELMLRNERTEAGDARPKVSEAIAEGANFLFNAYPDAYRVVNHILHNELDRRREGSAEPRPFGERHELPHMKNYKEWLPPAVV
ncbi:MAG: hypothetical protein AB7H77_12675, partial [Bdellovibrionales bacterium]